MKNKLPLETRLSLQVGLGFIGAPIMFVMILLEVGEERRATYVAIVGFGSLVSVLAGLAWWWFHHRGRFRPLPENSSAGTVGALGAGVALAVAPRLSFTAYLWTYIVTLFFAVAVVVVATLRTWDLRNRR